MKQPSNTPPQEDKHTESSKADSSKGHKNNASSYQWLTIVSVLLVIGLALFWISHSGNPYGHLYVKYYSPVRAMSAPDSAHQNDPFYRAMMDYEHHHYQKAIQGWENLSLQNRKDDTLYFFIASAYLAEQKPAKAISYFTIVTHIDSSHFTSDAYWYMGLAALKTGHKENAVQYFEKTRHKQKEAILSKLNP